MDREQLRALLDDEDIEILIDWAVVTFGGCESLLSALGHEKLSRWSVAMGLRDAPADDKG